MGKANKNLLVEKALLTAVDINILSDDYIHKPHDIKTSQKEKIKEDA